MGIAFLLTAISLVSVVLGAVLLPIAIVRLPEDYFVRAPGESRFADWSAALKLRAIARSTFGLLLVVVGIALLVLPGQGVLTILAGVAVAEFPGKYRLERWILRRKAVLSGLNAIRRRFGKAPLRVV